MRWLHNDILLFFVALPARLSASHAASQTDRRKAGTSNSIFVLHSLDSFRCAVIFCGVLYIGRKRSCCARECDASQPGNDSCRIAQVCLVAGCGRCGRGRRRRVPALGSYVASESESVRCRFGGVVRLEAKERRVAGRWVQHPLEMCRTGHAKPR